MVLLDRDDDFLQTGADVVLDTRLDPVLPRNAAYARAAWMLRAFPPPTRGPVNQTILTRVDTPACQGRASLSCARFGRARIGRCRRI